MVVCGQYIDVFVGCWYAWHPYEQFISCNSQGAQEVWLESDDEGNQKILDLMGKLETRRKHNL